MHACLCVWLCVWDGEREREGETEGWVQQKEEKNEKWNFIRKSICFPLIVVERPFPIRKFPPKKQGEEGNLIPVTSGEPATAVITSNNRFIPCCFPTPLYWFSSSVGTQHRVNRVSKTQYLRHMCVSNTHARAIIHGHTQTSDTCTTNRRLTIPFKTEREPVQPPSTQRDVWIYHNSGWEIVWAAGSR